MDLFRKMLTLQSLLSVAGNGEILTVTQSPLHLSAREGDSVTMTCRINSTNAELRIEWSKILPERKMMVLTFKGNTTKAYPNYTERTKHFFNDAVSSLTISRINLNDTGMYLCEVLIEIPPPVYRKSGNGTNLQIQVDFKESASSNDSTTVVLKENTSSNDNTTGTANNALQMVTVNGDPITLFCSVDSTKWILISCVSSIALVVSVTTFFLARRFITFKKEQPVYINVKYRNKAGENYRPTKEM